MWRLFILLQMFFVVFAKPTALNRPPDLNRPAALDRPAARQLEIDPSIGSGDSRVSTEQFLQDLLSSTLRGDALLRAYDTHYDGLPAKDQIREKMTYPQHVYEDLHKHRRTSRK